MMLVQTVSFCASIPIGLLFNCQFKMKTIWILWFAWLGSITVLEAAQLCPTRCTSCDPPSVHCERAEIDTMPITLNPSLEQLHLPHNQIDNLQMHLLDVYQNMHVLDLAHNRIQTLNEQVFKGLTHLKVINLNFDFITLLFFNRNSFFLYEFIYSL